MQPYITEEAAIWQEGHTRQYASNMVHVYKLLWTTTLQLAYATNNIELLCGASNVLVSSKSAHPSGWMSEELGWTHWSFVPEKPRKLICIWHWSNPTIWAMKTRLGSSICWSDASRSLPILNPHSSGSEYLILHLKLEQLDETVSM